MSPPIPLHPVWVLHARPWRESSLLLELFSARHGRVGVVARGARGARGRGRLLQPFRPLLASWGGRGELGTLGGVEEAGPAPRLEGHALVSGLYLNELLVRFLHRNDPHSRLFGLYGATLEALAGGEALEPLLRRFELRLLEEVGYGLELEHEAGDRAAPLRAGRRYDYRPEIGPVPLEGEPAGVAVEGGTLQALARGELEDPGVLREAKRLMRHLIRHHLGGRELRSRQLFGAGG
ncbi:MAG TPA: DNA repair protein RecO [Thiotrichales bacterium]|nr:DNA repair protein RecO [Thiotrichales bacterium]